MKRAASLFIVMEHSDDFEQGLSLIVRPGYPAGGVLDWQSSSGPVASFSTRAAARAAINRTEHYRLAFSVANLPEKKFCKVVRVDPPLEGQ